MASVRVLGQVIGNHMQCDYVCISAIVVYQAIVVLF